MYSYINLYIMQNKLRNIMNYLPYKKILLYTALLLFIPIVTTFAQDSSTIETAQSFMQRVAKMYATFQDFQADIIIKKEKTKSIGTLFSKSHNKLRINFSQPYNQVIISDGELFNIYVPSQNIVLQQKTRKQISSGSFITATGLDQLLKNYIASYLEKPKFTALDNSSNISVMKIRMKWRSSSQSFRELILSIGKDLLIYRVKAITHTGETLQFDFSNIKPNEGIPDARFDYTPPATAHVVENFLFEGSKE